jgi:hypothetical protein
MKQLFLTESLGSFCCWDFCLGFGAVIYQAAIDSLVLR